MTHTHAIIPPDADLQEIRCRGRVMLVPDQIIFNVDQAFVPYAPQPTRRGVYLRNRGICAY